MRFSDFQPVVYIVGLLSLGESCFAALFAVGDWAAGGSNADAFAAAAMLGIFLGGLMVFANRDRFENLTIRQAFLITTLAWAVMPAVGALPLFFSDLGIDYTDAYFEAMSGMTTTGSTILTGLDSMSPSILLWRAFLQWTGGVGIIVTAIAVLPLLRIGGMQLFQTESSDRSEKMLPRASQVARSISLTYVTLTVACMITYAAFGMSGFDALVHAMTTIPTGGYSTRDASFGAFGAGAQWASVIFMLSGAIPFVLYIRAVGGNLRPFLASGQLRLLLSLVFGAAALLAAWLIARQEMDALDAVRHALFNVTSIVTTTGYASTDYGAWGSFAVSAFLVLTFLGGCTGSTAGGLKMFRLIVLYRVFQTQLVHVFSPHTVVATRYEGKPIPDDVPDAVMAFTFLYFLAAIVIALFLAELGLDPLTALSAAATAIANVGPGLGPVVGPAGNFASLPDVAKWLLSFAMLLGRLELFTVLVLFAPRFWRA